MHKGLIDKNRRPVNLAQYEVKNYLPTFFQEEYPTFINFLEKYYEFADQDSASELIDHLLEAKDIIQVDDKLLTFIEDELLLGQSYFEGFQNKRKAAEFSNLLYNSKGTKYSIQQFFRMFFGVDPDIVYTKEEVFTVGESQIGPESLKRISDDTLYQVYAILIKIGIPLATWKEVYKLFVHPAGMYLGAEVQIISDVDISIDCMPTVLLDSEVGASLTLTGGFGEDGLGTTGYIDLTGLFLADSSGGTGIHYRQNMDDILEKYAAFTLEELERQYSTLQEVVESKSPTMDEDSDSQGSRVGLSNDVETMDKVKYHWYDSA